MSGEPLVLPIIRAVAEPWKLTCGSTAQAMVGGAGEQTDSLVEALTSFFEMVLIGPNLTCFRSFRISLFLSFFDSLIILLYYSITLHFTLFHSSLFHSLHIFPLFFSSSLSHIFTLPYLHRQFLRLLLDRARGGRQGKGGRTAVWLSSEI